MASMALVRAKADAESRQNEERRVAEKRRNIIVLCARYFQDLGFINTVQQIERDTNVSLDRVDAADNIDLSTVLTEYEDFYEMRFGRKPKLTRRLVADDEKTAARGRKESVDRKVSLPKLPPEAPSALERSESSPPAAAGTGGNGRRRERSEKRSKSQCNEEGRTSRGDRPPLAPDNSGAGEAKAGAAGGLDGLGLEGQNVAKAAASNAKASAAAREEKSDDARGGDDFYENQLLRALPPACSGDKEYRDLAMSISRDILTRNPGVTWDTIVGLDDAKALLKEAVVMPLKYPQFFTGLLSAWKGVLLFGPPGTGKTLLAKAVATECKTTFFNISASTVVSKWRGDSEKLIRVLFDLARHHQPSTIFIDELDSLMGARGGGDSEHEGSRRMKTELLIQMDGLTRDSKDQVFLLAASNLPWDLDSAMLRRLEKRILVNLPDAEARASMISTLLPDGTLAEKLDYARLAALTEEWSGSDIRLLCKEAAMHPLRRLMLEIESAERAAAAAAQPTRGSNRQRALDKAQQEAAAAAGASAVEDLKMGPVVESDVAKALERVHRAPAAHLDKYEAWQNSFGAA
eukprot:TRINITY_DN17930_c0_g1_i1.p1 TRINITY_DN17930_c0_g1~~TRINITY_DN17930_c0_g1_i1.p1  ORF type:complete len:576 (-),score=165.52 TRINITY_DN17930_c0_g1_i1:48-1775(-)